MVSKFNEVTTEIRFTDSLPSNNAYSPYEALTAASIAQNEVPHGVDLPKLTQRARGGCQNRVRTG